jgi:uncharacterized caspase-like protein
VSFASLGLVFRDRIAVALGLLLCALAAPVDAATERRVALVVGNASYTAVPPLANPLRDAKAISASLKRLGFEVVEGYDLKMDEMTSVVREFARKLDGAKAGVVYYAGHGIAVGDENYLLPVDASLTTEADLDFRAVNVQLVLRQMQRDERVNILILDACRDNPFTAQLAGRSRAVSRGLTAIETQSASGILIAFATDPRATALDGEKDGNSPFTAALLNHIETPEVSITTVMDRVRADVWEATGKKQKPWTNSSIIGEFKLNPTLRLAAVDASMAVKAIDAAAPVPALPQAPSFDRAQMDVKMWEVAERGNSPGDYKAYLEAFPSGQFAAFAKNRLASLMPATPPASAAAQPAGLADEALKNEVGSAATEAAIKLAAKERRELQIRLNLGGFKSGKLSGDFGPSQRDAIKQWQATRGIPATGFLTAMQVTALRAQSEPLYRRSLAQEEAKPAPAAKPGAAAKPAPAAQRRSSSPVASEPTAPNRTRGAVYEEDPVIRRDMARERQVVTERDAAGSAAGAAAVGSFLGGAIMGGILRGR